MDFDGLVLGPAFAIFGRDAAYTMPEGRPAVPCRVSLRTFAADAALGELQVQRTGRVLEVRKSEVAQPAERGLFVLAEPMFGHTAWRVAGKPACEDGDQLVWSMTVVPS